jgi:polysulfide reductase chain C
MAQIAWDLLLAADLFLSGLGAGAYITAALADIKGGKKYEKLARFGSHLSWPLVIMGLVILILEMGRPELNNPTHLMNIFNNLPSSMLTIEALLSGAFIAIGAATSFLWLARWKKTWLRTIIEIVGIVVASSLAASSGFVLALSRGIPLWESAFLPWIFVISAVLAGVALVGLTGTHLGSLLFPRFSTKPESTTLNLITKYASMMTVVLLIAIAGYIVDVAIFREATVGISNLVSGSMSIVFWPSLIIGFIVPLGIRVSIAKRAKEPGTEMGIKLLSLVSFLCIMIGVFVLRYAIIIAGQL